MLVCNCGHVTGATQESLAERFMTNDDDTDDGISAIDVYPAKSYSCVTFASELHAEKAFKRINGHLVHLSYVDRPPPALQSPWEDDRPLPPGLTVVEDFVTEEEEWQLLDSIQWEEEDVESLKNRRVKHYGHDFEYGSNSIDPTRPNGRPIPDLWTEIVLNRLE